MSDHPIIQVRFGDAPMTPPPAPPKRKRREVIEGWASFVRTMLVHLLITLPILALLILLAKDLMRAPVVIEDISLPSALSDRGFSGTVAAQRLWDAISQIRDEAEQAEVQSQPTTVRVADTRPTDQAVQSTGEGRESAARKTPYRDTGRTNRGLVAQSRQHNIVAPGTGVSLQAVASAIRGALNLPQTRVAGEILCRDDACSMANMALRLRVFTPNGLQIVNRGVIGSADPDDPRADPTEDQISAYFYDAALALLEIIEPYTVALYRYNKRAETEQALAAAERAISMNDREADRAATFVGYIFKTQGNFEDAIPRYELAIDIGDRRWFGRLFSQQGSAFAEPWWQLGDLLVQMGEYDEAIEKFQEAARLDPDQALILADWGYALAANGQVDAAIEKFDQAEGLAPEDASILVTWGRAEFATGNFDAATEKFERALAMAPRDPRVLVDWGNALLDFGWYDEGIDKFEAAARIAPRDPFVLTNWGNGLMIVESFDAAFEKFAEATRIAPANAQYWYDWGFALYWLDRSEDAVEKFERVVQLDPENAYAWFFIGSSLNQLGRYEEALDKFRRSTAIIPDDSADWNAWGQALNALGRHEEAIEKFERATQLDPQDAFAWYFWGFGLNELGRFDEALDKFQRSTDIDPSDPSDWNAWGFALSQLGRHDEAVEKLEQALDLDPDNATALQYLGDTLGDLGQHVEAIDLYDRLIALGFDSSLTWNNKGYSLGQLGRQQEASAAYWTATERDPDNAVAWKNLAWSIDARFSESDADCGVLLDEARAFEARAGDHAPDGFADRREAFEADCADPG